ncbi:unnamed protein product [Phytophthora fragariaefolia]|uniref:Unnamed protein product n=1 Tax=Phytophthora fragariaefolia TaxID=1490495 RepID=A0A9W6XLC6_9STRA|nr:unnamed protein product [Phytophthora fragariaefolia]
MYRCRANEGALSTHSGSGVLEVEITDQVKPPPLYRQAGRSCMRPKEVSDFTRGTKRKPNRGECAGSSNRIMRPPAIKTVPYGCDDSDDETKAIAAYFNVQVKGARTIKRGDYTCSRCNQIGHNARSCTTSLTEIEESGVSIVPGLYVIGECPFSACGMRDEYEREERLTVWSMVRYDNQCEERP